ncbi:MAG: hypothetical protein HZB25_06860 [Candidatus Eisenbacteria bacterium]|nr:hypothetical protein [Candidatus Eisenbacteria bacterium]
MRNPRGSGRSSAGPGAAGAAGAARRHARGWPARGQRAPGPGSPGPPALREHAPPTWFRDLLLALAGVLALEGLFLRPLLPVLRTHILVDDVQGHPGLRDAYPGLWVFWWVQKRLAAGLDPFFCDWVMPPIGAGLHFDSQRLLFTWLTLPVAKLLGVVGAYNVMVLALVCLGALAYFVFLRRTFELSRTAAFLGAAGFGLCPYFVLKATCHVNLLGAGLWGGALGALVHCYARNRFSVRAGLVFSACAWAAFWNSFVEFFMLAVVGLLVVAVFEVLRGGRAPAARWRKAVFFACLLPGTPSLLFLRASPWSDQAVIPLYDGVTLAGLFTFPRLSALSALRFAEIPEFWGVYLPVSCLALAVFGAVRLWRAPGARPAALGFAALALLCVALTVNAAGLPSAGLELLPRGRAFRVMPRFFPMVMFFVMIFAAFGVDALRSLRRPAWKWGMATALLALAAVEYFPLRLEAGAVRAFALTPAQHRAMEDGRSVLVYPRGGYGPRDDTYQVALDRPTVFAWYLALGGRGPYKHLVRRAPRTYYNWADPWNGPWDPLLRLELARLNVGYVLLGDRELLKLLPPAVRVLARTDSSVLVRLPREREEDLVREIQALPGLPVGVTLPPGWTPPR